MQIVIHRLESITSTNDAAARMAREGAPEGTVVVAQEQTAGRGRHGRKWSSPAGGLYLSIILRPDLPFEDLRQMAFLAAVASAEAVGQVSGLPARIKWPNDVLLNARKVCGILIEACLRFRPWRICSLRSVVVGFGINVNNQEFPPEISQAATSIALEVGRPIAVEEVEEALLSHLDARYSRYLAAGFAPILSEWRNLDCTAGRQVTVSTAEGAIEGTAVEIDPHGDLIIEREDGTRTHVTAGDAVLRDT